MMELIGDNDLPGGSILHDTESDDDFNGEKDDGVGNSSCPILPAGPVRLDAAGGSQGKPSPPQKRIRVSTQGGFAAPAAVKQVKKKVKKPSSTGIKVQQKKLDFSKLRYSDDGPDIEQIFMEVKLQYPDLFQPLKTEEGETVFRDLDIVKAAFPEAKDINNKYKKLKQNAWSELLDEIKGVPRSG